MKSAWLWVVAAGAAILAAAESSPLLAFTIKSGVYGTLQDVMLVALDAVVRVWASHGLGPPVITSIEDGVHAVNSKHYAGLAFDLRLNDIPAELHGRLKIEVEQLAGDGFDVVHEYHGQARDHLHVEFDPR